LYTNTEGFHNFAGGCNALYDNATGVYNVELGSFSLHSNTSGHENAAVGYASQADNISGERNVAAGYRSLLNNETGSFNTAIGFEAGPAELLTHLENTSALGCQVVVTVSDQVRIGNSDITSIGAYSAWTIITDGMFHKNVREEIAGIDFIIKLRPVTFQPDVQVVKHHTGVKDSSTNQSKTRQPGMRKEEKLQSGFIPQELEAAAHAMGYEFSGVDAPKNENDLYGLRYAEFVVPLVKGIQEQQAMIEAQQTLIDELRERIEGLESFQK